MNPGGEAADAILKGEIEVTVEMVKLAGLGTKNLVALIWALAHNDETARRMVQEGCEPVPFYIKHSDADKFKKMAKEYKIKDIKIVRGAGGNMCDVIAKASDAALINRIMERMGYTAPSVEDAGKKSVVQALSALKSKGPERGSTEKTLDTAQIGTPGPDLSELIHEPRALIGHPEQFRQYLIISAQMRYSENNQALIYEQRPDAGPVLSKSAWKECGRVVRDDAQPIYIKAPDPSGTKGVYVDVPVYALSDTSAGPPPHFPALNGDELTKACNELIATSPAPVIMSEAPGPAHYDPEKRAIMINLDAPAADLFHDLAVTTAHARMHERWGDGYLRDGAESICRSAAVVTCARYGVDPSRHNLTEAAAWVTDLDPAKEHYVSQFLSDVSVAAGPHTHSKPRSRTRKSPERVR